MTELITSELELLFRRLVKHADEEADGRLTILKRGKDRWRVGFHHHTPFTHFDIEVMAEGKTLTEAAINALEDKEDVGDKLVRVQQMIAEGTAKWEKMTPEQRAKESQADGRQSMKEWLDSLPNPAEWQKQWAARM